MKTYLQLNLSDIPRPRALQTWLTFNNIKKADLAQELNTQPSNISKIIKGERAPAKHVEKLIALGIPRELLPNPSMRGPGRPPKLTLS